MLASAPMAHASGFGLREGSADELGTAFAGGPAKAYDAGTVWDNPAGMALLSQDEFETGLSYIGPSATFTGSATNPIGGNVSGVPGGNSIAPAADAAAFGVWTLGPAWRIGVSLTTPFGERVAYPGDFLGRYQSLTSSITDINFGVAASYQVNPHFSIGFGPNFDYFTARLTQDLNLGALSAGTGQDANVGVRGNSLGVGYNLGALYQFDDATRIGIDYHSRIQHSINGSQNVVIPAIYSIADPGVLPLLEALNSKATTSITLPDSLSIGLYHQITPAWAVMGSVQWTDWSLFNKLAVRATNGSGTTVINENWKNTWYAGVGTNYQLTDQILLQAGAAYDGSPVTNANRTTRVPDSDHYDVGVGVQYALNANTTLELAYGHVFTPGGSIHNTASTSPTAPSGTINGKYATSDNSVTAGVDAKF
jgi:long-chain fatty acid transport protein